MADGLIRKVDCVSMPVADLSAAVVFYRDKLGHDLIWRSNTQAGFRLPDTDTELVVHTEPRPGASELLGGLCLLLYDSSLKRVARW